LHFVQDDKARTERDERYFAKGCRSCNATCCQIRRTRINFRSYQIAFKYPIGSIQLKMKTTLARFLPILFVLVFAAIVTAGDFNSVVMQAGATLPTINVPADRFLTIRN